jgi:peptide/nickel transport system substrate-binding protein
MLDWSNFGIVSEDEVNAAGGAEAAANNPVLGSGKYKFKEWKRGQSITLERNDNYWDKDWKGYYKTIVFTFTSDAAARAMAVQSGDSQVAYDMPVSQASTYLASTDVQTVMYTFGQVGHLWYNMSDGHDATQNQKVREAIDKALDYDAIAQVGTAGTGKAALGYFDTDSKYYNQTYTEDERKVDVEGAKALLKEAGYESGLELTAIGLQDVVPVYTVMQENLRAVGITLNIKTTDTAQFVQDAFGGNYDIIDVGELTDARYPTLLPFLRSANIASGYVIGGPKATTDAIDSAIETAIEETDEAKAKEELGAIEQTMKEQTIVSNLYPEMHASVIAKDLKGYTTIERGFMDPTNFYK